MEKTYQMKVLGKKKLSDFWSIHEDVKTRLVTWIFEVEEADWKTTHDIKRRYSSASFLSGNLVIINVKGNKYRLLTKVDFENQKVLVLKIGTHEEYKNWNL